MVTAHFIDGDALKDSGGAVRFVTAWLGREANSKPFIAAEQKRLQGDLFGWADQHPSRPVTRPSA